MSDSSSNNWSEEHGSFLLLLKETPKLPDTVAVAVEEATTQKSLTPAAVHAVGDAVKASSTLSDVGSVQPLNDWQSRLTTIAPSAQELKALATELKVSSVTVGKKIKVR